MTLLNFDGLKIFNSRTLSLLNLLTGSFRYISVKNTELIFNFYHL